MTAPRLLLLCALAYVWTVGIGLWLWAVACWFYGHYRVNAWWAFPVTFAIVWVLT